MPSNYKKAMLRIQPLAPLSLVTSIPGSFYRSSQEPADAMIYGMLENIIGWHYSPEIRKALKKVAVKNLKKIEQAYKDFTSESGYEPFIQNYVRINKLFLKPTVQSFTDLWTQHQKHNDKRHFDGVRNYDWRYTKQINTASNDAEKAALLKEYTSHFPNYYQSPKRREYIIAKSEFIYEIEIADAFIDYLIESIENPVSTPFLGTSEGWVDVKIEVV